MPRALRILLTFTTALSVLASIVVLGFWVMSYIRPTHLHIGHTADGHDREIRSAHGSLYVGAVHVDPVRKKRFFRKSESRRYYHFEILAIAAMPAMAHGLGVMMYRESRKRALMPGTPEAEPFL